MEMNEREELQDDTPLPNAGMLEDIFDKVQDYVGIQVEIVKLKSIGHISKAGSRLITGLIIGIFFTLFFLILSFGVAFWIGESMGHLYQGFLIVAGFYLILTILFYLLRKKLFHKLIHNNLTSQLLK